ncbi:MAG: 6-bladed beta-propeller [Ignavibacteria bacterium]|nr:6-bladed beta-propeller [Ignavibacteria bacterium]
MKNLKLTIQLRLLLVLILATSLSCNEKAKKENLKSNSFYTIPFAEIVKNKREVKLSEFATDVKFIQFENNSKALIGRVKEIQLTKDYIFVNSGKNPVIQFSRNGKYIRHIGTTGRGPGEYDICRALSIDEQNERIYIQSNATQSMLIFNFDGKFINAIKYPAIERLYNVWSRDSLLLSFAEPMEGNEPYVFIEHNEQGDTLQTVPNHIFWNNKDKYYNIIFFTGLNCFYRFENQLHMKGWYNDTVYSYDENNKIVPKFFIDLKEHKIPDDLIYERKTIRSMPDDVCWVGVHETSNYVFIPYGYHFDMLKSSEEGKEEEGCILYNKKTKESVAIEETKQGGFINDVSGGPDFRPIVTNDTLAIMLVSALEMKRYLDSDKFKNQEVNFPDEKEKLNQLKKTIKEDDNHFLVLVKQ